MLLELTSYLFSGKKDDIAACKKILEKSNLTGYQVHDVFINFLKIKLWDSFCQSIFFLRSSYISCMSTLHISCISFDILYILIFCVHQALVPLNSVLTDFLLLQIGKTKVFLRAGQMAELDGQRGEILGRSATKIQRRACTYMCRKKFVLLKSSATKIQAFCRGNKSFIYVQT